MTSSMTFETMFSLKGRVALVTGAAYGIGFAIARALAKAGAKVAFNCRSRQHLEMALEEYRKEGRRRPRLYCRRDGGNPGQGPDCED